MYGIDVVAEAVAKMSNTDYESENITALQTLSLIGVALPLNMAWSEQLTADQQQYFTDSLMIGSDSSYAAVAAADESKYMMDSSSMNQETSAQNNMVQEEKSEVSSLGNAMTQVYSTEQGPEQLLKSLNSAIRSFAGMN